MLLFFFNAPRHLTDSSALWTASMTISSSSAFIFYPFCPEIWETGRAFPIPWYTCSLQNAGLSRNICGNTTQTYAPPFVYHFPSNPGCKCKRNPSGPFFLIDFEKPPTVLFLDYGENIHAGDFQNTYSV